MAFAALFPPSVANVMRVQRDGWEVRNLIVLDALQVAPAFEKAVIVGNLRRSETVVKGNWDLLAH